MKDKMEMRDEVEVKLSPAIPQEPSEIRFRCTSCPRIYLLTVEDDFTYYCPRCGARMEKENVNK